MYMNIYVIIVYIAISIASAPSAIRMMTLQSTLSLEERKQMTEVTAIQAELLPHRGLECMYSSISSSSSNIQLAFTLRLIPRAYAASTEAPMASSCGVLIITTISRH